MHKGGPIIRIGPLLSLSSLDACVTAVKKKQGLTLANAVPDRGDRSNRPA